ncbi:helix-turn-helix domain-containing GNAT family N-acetyltransferase [Rhodopseudomonas sp. B29]|uniref:bifunctional helix-turn-helix transcriptional regulator/GNAT family N-acetyltransferase n=1 Tax=Rhodopseudomonas sp. B29 TaxID=95607 RepID=UPI00034517D1|nr:helix-turn-helix domain-containing GNAT family N-acetyltransferase [Rhodopseudomonas sp. B29]
MQQDLTNDETVEAVRAFNRFYTARLGVLEQHLYASPYSLTEARVLYELSQREHVTATEIAAELGLDAGYLSRIVQSFDKAGLIKRTPSPADRRQHLLSLTAKGRASYAKLERSSQQDVGRMLAALAPDDRAEIVAAMATIQRTMSSTQHPPPILREPRPGDIGWIVQSHGAFYAAEYGFNAAFEALVAQIAGDFLAKHDPSRERCWIAEYKGVQAGSLFLVDAGGGMAKFRLLLVTPQARGQRIGRRLVDEAIAFARRSGYRGITLWTQSILVAARGIYQQAGFKLVGTEPHRMFGPELTGETWELTL